MPQDLADLGQRHAGSDQRCRQRVAQAVRADRRDPGTVAGAPHDRRHPATPQRANGRERPQEELPPVGLRAAPLQVAHERFSDVDGQWKPVLSPALAPHHDLPGSPVDVVEAQRCDLAGAQAEAEQHEQHGVVPAAVAAPAVA